MHRITSILGSLVVAMTLTAAANGQDLENTLYMELEDGRVVIELRPDLAPKHVARIKELTREGFYDGIVFHRVIAGFMAQGGDPEGTGQGGPGYTIPAEIKRRHVRGSVAAARLGDPVNPKRASSGSQFYICFQATPQLDGAYTVFGQVVEGMEAVDQLQRVQPPARGGDVMEKVVVKRVPGE